MNSSKRYRIRKCFNKETTSFICFIIWIQRSTLKHLSPLFPWYKKENDPLISCLLFLETCNWRDTPQQQSKHFHDSIVTESQNGLDWKETKNLYNFNLLPMAGTPSTRPVFPEPHATWPWTFLGMRQLQLLCVTCARASPSQQLRISSWYLI